MYGRKMNVCLADGTAMPTYAHDGDAGFDLCIAEDVRLEPNASAVCGLGFACEIPSGAGQSQLRHRVSSQGYARVPDGRCPVRAVRSCRGR